MATGTHAGIFKSKHNVILLVIFPHIRSAWQRGYSAHVVFRYPSAGIACLPSKCFLRCTVSNTDPPLRSCRESRAKGWSHLHSTRHRAICHLLNITLEKKGLMTGPRDGTIVQKTVKMPRQKTLALIGSIGDCCPLIWGIRGPFLLPRAVGV